MSPNVQTTQIQENGTMNARSQNRNGRLAALAAAAALLAACSGSGTDPAAPAAAAAGAGASTQALVPHVAKAIDPTCTGGAHEKHITMFDCTTCHPAGGSFVFEVPYIKTFPGGTSTAGGTITRGSPTTCTVACHYPLGAPASSVAWNAPAPLLCTACHPTSALPGAHPAVNANSTRADCAACHSLTGHMGGTVTLANHPASWMDQANAGFHAYAANQGLGQCQSCHAADLSGGATGVSCASCHGATWRTSCTMCHGGVGSANGAPPKTVWGRSADTVRVGAHATHLAASASAAAVDCNVCHPKPADALTSGHIDAKDVADVAFAGLATVAVGTPTWNRTSATCGNTYCHGGSLAGGTNRTPVWTSVGTGQAACGTCHGLPPPSPHPSAAGLGSCATCHPQTMTGAGALIAASAGGKHLNGVVEAAGGGHPATWMDTGSTGFHAYSANANLASCQGCHGTNLDGVGGSASTSCAQCHGATWKTTCTMCHGGVANASGAPPKATWGYAGDPARGGGTADPVRVGAHTAHVTASSTAPAFACAVCHVEPASALSAGHVDGPTATVTFGGVATLSGAAPAWNRATATCGTTYCHGGYSGVYNYTGRDGNGDPIPLSVAYTGSMASPAWTDGVQGCFSCHRGGAPVGYWHTGLHTAGNNCDLCHPDANAAGTAITNTSLHLNGVVDVTPKWKSTCFNCH
jgi:predicted CxxxxCH...CXXCH cytochrome family protein